MGGAGKAPMCTYFSDASSYAGAPRQPAFCERTRRCGALLPAFLTNLVARSVAHARALDEPLLWPRPLRRGANRPRRRSVMVLGGTANRCAGKPADHGPEGS